MTATHRLGVHVSIEGGIEEALARASRLGCTTLQMFSRSPRGGRPPVLTDEMLQRFHRQREAAGLTPLVVHGPYIINLASPEAAMWQQSVGLYRQEYERCAQLRADYLVTHVGSHRGEGETAGVARVIDALNQTLEAREAPVMILLENTAGAGQGIGFRFEHLRDIRAGVMHPERVGICLDTAHLFAAGFPIHTETGLEETWALFEQVVGFAHLKLIHLNDSKSAFNSHVDRHWHLGEGQIGLDAMRRIVPHPRLREVPLILETPKKQPTDDPRNLATVRRLLGIETRLPPPRSIRRSTVTS